MRLPARWSSTRVSGFRDVRCGDPCARIQKEPSHAVFKPRADLNKTPAWPLQTCPNPIPARRYSGSCPIVQLHYPMCRQCACVCGTRRHVGELGAGKEPQVWRHIDGSASPLIVRVVRGLMSPGLQVRRLPKRWAGGLGGLVGLVLARIRRCSHVAPVLLACRSCAARTSLRRLSGTSQNMPERAKPER